MARRPEVQDQASGLRRLLGGQAALRSAGIFGPDAALNAAAGASLAFALAHRGNQVGVIDEAPGPRNVAGQFGLSPHFGLGDVLRHGRRLEAALAVGPNGVRVLEATRGLQTAAEAAEWAWAQLASGAADLRWDWVLLTTPAAEQPGLALASIQRLLVVPAVKTRLTDAYAVLKAAQQRQPDGQWHVLLMNLTDIEQGRQLFAALADTARRFLGIELGYFGTVPQDDKLDMAARAMRPLLELSPASPAAAVFRNLAEAMQAWPLPVPAMDAESFWRRLGLFGRLAAPTPTVSGRALPRGHAYG